MKADPREPSEDAEAAQDVLIGSGQEVGGAGWPLQGEHALQCSREGWRGGIGAVPNKAPTPVMKSLY